MCGISGLWRFDGGGEDGLRRRATAMSDAIRHRGPDDGGVFVDAGAGLAFSQRRLAIIDLSPAGHQPMASACGRFVINYNGELYNTEAVRAGLAGRDIQFRGHSDTEVIVESIAAFGVEETIARCEGMFAMAVWDRRDRRLYLVRDRIGIKPLYWTKNDRELLFGSELKTLIAAGFEGDVDREALGDYFRYGYIQGPRTIWRGVQKLTPGAILRIDAGGSADESIYWSPREAALSGLAARNEPFDEGERLDALETALAGSVKRHMVSDVPLGAFLSGGIDSSLVTALMQRQSARPVNTFSIGFQEARFDEAPHARAVADHLGTNHTELTATDALARDVIPELPQYFDEPFGDPSQIPTLLLCRLTRQHVTVALSGDGGDELFAGYARYDWGETIRKRRKLLPGPLARVAAGGVRQLSPAAWNAVLAATPLSRRFDAPGDKLHKLAATLGGSRSDAYRALVTAWHDTQSVVIGAGPPDGPHTDRSLEKDFPNFVDQMQYVDLVTYLPEDILTKVDRASMAVSLEARVPLLDHTIVERAWATPMSMKRRDGVSKWALREILYRHVPRDIVDRPKMGFGVPINEWLRGPLRDWAEALISERRLRAEGYLDPQAVRKVWDDHLSGARNMRYALWSLLMFQAWLENAKAGDSHVGLVAAQ